MARKATEFPAQWVQMSDFKWTKNMTKKDRWSAKQFIDWILADVEKRDREILDLWNELAEEHRSTMRKLADLRDRKDYEIWSFKKTAAKFQALYEHESWKNTTLAIIAIIACLIMLWMWIYCFA
jgi:ferric-dicitrate binding protein FerR (iron transport regulator)